MKEILLTTLRDKNTGMAEFRNASEKLALMLAGKVFDSLPKKEIPVQTPIDKATGVVLKNDVVLIAILRSALALLFPFMRYFENAKVGFVGLKRDEKTAIAHLYYKNLPKISVNDDVILLDPMIATGGSGCDALKFLKELGVKEEKIIYVAVISATPGIERVKKEYPKIKIMCVQEDKILNDAKYIVPGLGDFGDRFFGTIPE